MVFILQQQKAHLCAGSPWAVPFHSAHCVPPFLLLRDVDVPVFPLTCLFLPFVIFFSFCYTSCFLPFVFSITCGISVEIFLQSILLLLFVYVKGCGSWLKSMSKTSRGGAERAMQSQLKQNSSYWFISKSI